MLGLEYQPTEFLSRQRKRDRLESNRMVPKLWKRRRRRRDYCRGCIIEHSNTAYLVQRLFLFSLVASLYATNEGNNCLCDAFTTPKSHRTGIPNRIDQITTLTIENRTRKRSISSIPRLIARNEASITSSLNSSASDNNISGGADNNNNSGKNKNNAEIAGLILAVGIILSLAGITGPSGSGVGNGDTSTSVAVMTKVVENTVPTTSTEVVAVTLGESIGGVIGAIFSVAINFVLRGGKTTEVDPSKSLESENKKNKKQNKKSLISQGLSDSDYFIANSASNSFLLEIVGVEQSVAKYVSIFVATIPSQLVKIGSRIEEQKSLKAQEFKSTSPSNGQQKEARKKQNEISASVSTTTESNAAIAATAIDFVEIFADVTRWLEYDVLKTEYGETVLSKLWLVENDVSTVNPVQSAITFAVFGSLASVSSRWYADVLYGRFRYGPIEKQQEVRKRKNAEWFSIYSSTAASAAALFGCYEFFQLPIGRYIQGTLSGGIEGCFGSSKFDACMQTYIDTNSPGPTTEAQFRALITNLYAVYVRLQDIAGDTTADDVSALIRAWSVSLASYIANMQ